MQRLLTYFLPFLGVGAAAALTLVPGSEARAEPMFDGQRIVSMDRMQVVQPGRDAILRVQVNYQLQQPIAALGGLDEQKAAMKLDHATFYELASKECELLHSVFPGNCRLAALNVSGPIGQSFNGIRFATANATFEVTPPAIDPATKP